MVKYLRAANVKDGRLDLTDVKEMNFTPSEQAIYALRPGDVLISEGAGSLTAVGTSAVWQGEIDGTVCFQNTLLRARPRRGVEPRFLAWWCRHGYASGMFASVAGGANIFHLGAERIRALPATMPATARQKEIADFLDAETTRVDGIIKARIMMIESLRERTTVALTALVMSGSPSIHVHLDAGEFVPDPQPEWRRTQLRHIPCEVQTGPFGSQLHADEYVENGCPVVNPGLRV